MTAEEQQRLLDRLALLSNMTVARGCSQGEADAAAFKLGHAVIEHGISLSFGTASSTQTAKEKTKLAKEWLRLQAEKTRLEAAWAQYHATRQRQEKAQRRRRPDPDDDADDAEPYDEDDFAGDDHTTSDPSIWRGDIVTCRHRTDKAMLFADGDGVEFWVPISQLRRGCELWQQGDGGILYVNRWLAEKRGWV